MQHVSDQLFEQVFGCEEEALNRQVLEQMFIDEPQLVKEYPTQPSAARNTILATFSQRMALAHHMNRRYGHNSTKNCTCEQCRRNAKKAV